MNHMKNLKYFFLSLLMVPLSVSAQNWQMVWSDEFDGDSLDSAKWSYQTGTGSDYGLTDWGNNELQYYREQNIAVSDGLLRVSAKKEFYGGKSYSSGRIRTINRGDWKYCKIEFRAKMPEGQGLWAAIWMLPTDEDYGGWAASGELDIMEYLGHEASTVHGTLHFGGGWPNNQSKGTSYQTDTWSFSSEFHDFAIVWEERKIRWYVDGKLYQTQGEGDWYSSAAGFPAPFDRRFHLLINLAVGGNWPGSPNGNTEFPQDILVDYIRVYQDLPVGLKPVANPDTRFSLKQNYPNPFHPKTRISFSTAQPEHVSLDVFDVTGRLVQTLVDGHHQPGKYLVEFNGTEFPSGLYTYRIIAGDLQETRQMMLLGD